MTFVWTDHALDRCDERHVRDGRVEDVIETEGAFREVNDEAGGYQLPLLNRDGEKCEVVYVHPDDDETVAVIVTVHRVRERPRRSRPS
jgi:hypothetical protein